MYTLPVLGICFGLAIAFIYFLIPLRIKQTLAHIVAALAAFITGDFGMFGQGGGSRTSLKFKIVLGIIIFLGVSILAGIFFGIY